MTGVPPSGSGLRPDGLRQSALSQAEPLVPNAAFSPGPWSWHQCFDPTGKHLTSLDICPHGGHSLSGAAVLASVWGGQEANARLIASAPQLHDAVTAIRKVRDGYASQMKFCDIEAMGYFREFVRRIDVALASAMSAFGQDPKGLEAKPASATGKAGDAQEKPGSRKAGA
jgi:hypothetical protein